MDVEHINPIESINDAVEETEDNAALAQTAASVAIEAASAAYDAAELSAKIDVLITETATINANIASVRGLVEQVIASNVQDDEPEIIINIDSDGDGDSFDSDTSEDEPETEIDSGEIVDEEPVTEVEQPSLEPIERPKSKRGLRKNRRR